MVKSNGQTKAKSKATTKTKPKSLVKGRRERNPSADQRLSFDPPAKNDMPGQTVASPSSHVHESINRVMAECDKVDAALIEMTRQDMPSLAIKELAAAGSGNGVKRGWAVVSADPQKPLTEWQARDIVAAMRSPPTNARN